MFSKITLGKILGININVHFTWIIIFFIVSWNLSDGLYKEIYPEMASFGHWFWAVLAALIFFGSILFHELAHSVVAMRYKIGVKSITLFLFGGVASINKEPDSPRKEFFIAVVGPIASLFLAISFLYGSGLGMVTLSEDLITLFGSYHPQQVTFFWLGSINLFLALFNLLPGFPLDGGRILRSIIWSINNDLKRSTKYSSIMGQITAVIFILMGLLMLFRITPLFEATTPTSGIWFILLGSFLFFAARMSYRQMELEGLLSNIEVGKIMNSDITCADSHLPISSFTNKTGVENKRSGLFLLTNSQQKLTGVLKMEDARKVPLTKRAETSAIQMMLPLSILDCLRPTERASRAFQLLQKEEPGVVLINRGENVIGTITLHDIILWLDRNERVRTP
jgi:Zn-dependent protease